MTPAGTSRTLIQPNLTKPYQTFPDLTIPCTFISSTAVLNISHNSHFLSASPHIHSGTIFGRSRALSLTHPGESTFSPSLRWRLPLRTMTAASTAKNDTDAAVDIMLSHPFNIVNVARLVATAPCACACTCVIFHFKPMFAICIWSQPLRPSYWFIENREKVTAGAKPSHVKRQNDYMSSSLTHVLTMFILMTHRCSVYPGGRVTKTVHTNPQHANTCWRKCPKSKRD